MAKAGLHLIKNCILCSKEYRQSRSDQLYCSKKCYSYVWRSLHNKGGIYWKGILEKKCQTCKNIFYPSILSQKYCSNSCFHKEDNKRKRIKYRNSNKYKGNAFGKNWSKGKKFINRRIGTYSICQSCNKKFYIMPCYKKRGGDKFCSNFCRIKSLTYKLNSRGNQGYYDINGKKIFFRSSWEANYALYLNFLINKKQIKGWEYEKDTFWFEKIKRGIRSYKPDFKIYNNNETIEYHEVKGWMDKKSKTKLNRMRIYYPDIKLILIDSECYRNLKNQIGRLLKFY